VDKYHSHLLQRLAGPHNNAINSLFVKTFIGCLLPSASSEYSELEPIPDDFFSPLVAKIQLEVL
jgi:hypothetical protein